MSDIEATAAGLPQFRELDRTVLARGLVVNLCRAHIETPDGTLVERDIVEHPGAVSVVPLHDDGTVTLVRQYRAPVDRWLLEIPAGKRDVDGEPPIETARRELQEEVGLAADRFELLVEFYNSPGFADEAMTVFVASGLRSVPTALDGAEEEHAEVIAMSLDDAVAAVRSGAISDAKTIIGLLALAARTKG